MKDISNNDRLFCNSFIVEPIKGENKLEYCKIVGEILFLRTENIIKIFIKKVFEFCF
jgi:hypothetical protein